MKRKQAQRIIGRVDKVDLPEFGISDLDCKVDTGADTSSIHCTKVRIVEKNGTELLRFRVLDKKHPLYKDVVQEVSDFSEKRIKSSNGTAEMRFVIRTKLKIFNTLHNITFTLSDREKMKYPVLLGKRFLKNKFLVDVSERDLSYKLKNPKP